MNSSVNTPGVAGGCGQFFFDLRQAFFRFGDPLFDGLKFTRFLKT